MGNFELNEWLYNIYAHLEKNYLTFLCKKSIFAWENLQIQMKMVTSKCYFELPVIQRIQVIVGVCNINLWMDFFICVNHDVIVMRANPPVGGIFFRLA